MDNDGIKAPDNVVPNNNNADELALEDMLK